ncbi:MAG: twitching motility protein PilT [Clostridiales bacterium]|nr:twitching motility protein PilT [Clostridiales bacterium]MCD8216268.1 twitching motility protein PilT [Clostridiales bacterium]
MVQLLISAKGHGKTRQLINMANDAQRTAKGNIVFIDDNKKHIFDIHSGVRFVETSACDLYNYREFAGFIFGILSQNSDIEKIFVDGLYKIITVLTDDDLVKLVKRLDVISKEEEVDFIIGMSSDYGIIPEAVKEYVLV